MINVKNYTTLKNKFINLKYLSLAIISVALSAISIIHPEFASKGIKSAVGCCINILIPSMFFLVFISMAIIKSDISERTKIILEEITKFLFYLPGAAAPTILLSLFGGYPVGASGTAELYHKKEINEEQMNRMMLFCVNSGPAFIVSALGKTLLGSVKIGSILFFAQILSSILIGVISGIIARTKKYEFYHKNLYFKINNLNFANLIVESCQSACKTLINICAPITLFFAVISIFENLNVINYATKIFSKLGLEYTCAKSIIISLIEMTQGCICAAKSKAPLWVFSFILGFGGICAHTQVISELRKSPFKYSKFFIMRILNGLITALIFKIDIFKFKI